MLPIVLSIVGGMLPTIVDAFRSGKSPEEAAQIIAPKRKEMIDRLTGSGMNASAAEKMADEAMKGELEKAQLPEPMNPWISTALMAAGGYGGYRAGKAIKAARAAKAAPTTAVDAAKVAVAQAEKPVAKAGMVDDGNFRSAKVDAAMKGKMDTVTPGPMDPSRGLPAPEGQRRLTMGPRYRGKDQGPAVEPKTIDVEAEVVRNTPRTPYPSLNDEAAVLTSRGVGPGRNTKSFQMSDPVEPARLNGPFPDEFASARTATLEFPPAGPTIVANSGRAASKAANRMRTQTAPAQMDEMRRAKAEAEAKIKQAQMDIEYERQKYADLIGG
jgi:hypothetical protein